MAATRLHLSLVAGCHLAGEALATPHGPLALAPLERGAAERLLAGGDTREALLAQATEAAGYAGFLGALHLLFELDRRLLLVRSVSLAGTPLLAGVPLNAHFHAGEPSIDGAARYVLSRFALIRREKGRWALESPLSRMRVTVGGPGMRLIDALAEPRTIAGLAAATGLPEGTAALALALLAQADLLAAVDAADGEREPEASPALATWEFHDLLLHARSRIGRHAGGYGGTFPGRNRFAPLPDAKPDEEGETVALERPDRADLESRDLPFTRVLEERRSRRAFGEPPITLSQLGHLLYRAARETRPMVEGAEAARRVYPGGGGVYEIEVYLVVSLCEGLDPGLYRYRPAAHCLARIAGATPEVAQLLESARRIGRAETPVQVALLLAARFRRLSYKYESIAYATLLKDVGAVLQTLYLVATAMGLAACAVGGGDSELFARAAGTDPWEEATVGEMLLGSRKEEITPRAGT